MKRSPLFTIFVVVFLDLLGFGIVIPQLGIYGHRFGASGLVVGLLGSSYSAMQFLFAPVLGRLSDRVGRRPVILISLLGSVAGYSVFGFAHSLAWLFAGRILQGICGANIATAQAYIADSTPPAERARSLGMYLGAAFGLGFIFGPALGGALSHWGNLGLGLVAAAMSLSAFFVALVRLPESLPPERRSASARRAGWIPPLADVIELPGVPRAIFVFGLATLAFSMMEGVFSMYLLVHFFGGSAQGFNPAHPDPLAARAGMWTGAIFVAIGVVSTVVQGGLIGKLRARFGEPKLVLFGVASMAVAFVLVALAPSIWLVFPAMGVLAVGQGLNTPSLSSLVSQLAPPTRQGEVIGAYQSVGSLARTFGPALGGLVFQAAGQKMPFVAAAVVMAVAAALAQRLLAPEAHAGDASVIRPTSG